MPATARAAPLALALALACASAPEPPVDSERRHSQALARKIDALRAEIDERGPGPRRALDFAQLARGDYRSRQRLGERRPDPALTDEAVTILREAAAQSPEDAGELLTAAAEIHELRGEPGKAATIFAQLIAAEPATEPFRRMLDLPRGPEVDAAVVESCPRVRPLADERDALDLARICLDAAGSERALSWAGAEQDLERLAEITGEPSREQVAEQLADARIRVFSERRATMAAIAAVFGAGRCHVENCGRGGWTGRGIDGDVHVRCGASGCLHDGWDARLPGGLIARTTCHARDCVSRGWRTEYPNGEVAETRCVYEDCLRAGWTTTLPDETTVDTRCAGDDCRARGWTTTLGEGEEFTCRCVRERCDNHGALCR